MLALSPSKPFLNETYLERYSPSEEMFHSILFVIYGFRQAFQ